MKAIVVLNGELPGKAFIKSLARGVKVIVAADGAAKKLMAAGIKPTTVVGDMDSLDKTTIQKIKRLKIKVITLPVEKDFTDGFFALQEAVKQGASDIALLGVFGGPRLDHWIANLLMLCAGELIGTRITAMDEDNLLVVVRRHQTIDGKQGEIVSLIPIGGKVSGIDTSGLKYALKNGTLETGSTRGVSNVMTSGKASISVKSGLLLLAHHKAMR